MIGSMLLLQEEGMDAPENGIPLQIAVQNTGTDFWSICNSSKSPC